MRSFALVLALVLSFLWTEPAQAVRGTPALEPILRVDTTMHTAMIRRLAYDARQERLITAADDKTVKIWQLPEGRLHATLRVPIDAGHEGQLFALALSPDGARLAVAGWTCWDWLASACIYVFDVASGEIVRRVGGLPDAASALAWSPDGRFLAVGLQGRSGVRVMRTDTFVEVAADTLYDDKVMEVAYNAAGWLAVVALDARVRVYRPDHRLHGRLSLRAGRQPAAVRFAPDARRIAIGFLDVAAVAVLDATTLASLQVHSLAHDPAQRSLPNVAWSHDGRTLYAAGERGDGARNLLHRFSDARAADALPIPARRVSELQPLSGERIAYAAEDPRLGVIAANGELSLDRGSDLHDVAAADFRLAASSDGTAIEIATATGMRRFNALTETGRTGASDRHYSVARREAPGWSVELAPDRLGVRINGRVPALDDYELVRAHAIAPQADAVVLGTEWALRRLDRDALERWHVKLPAIVRALLWSEDGRFVIAALSDGSVRWFRARDGRELLAYFAPATGDEWVAWTPAGYYMSSAHGDHLVGWHLNRGIDDTPDFYRAVQFERVLYRPEIVSAALRPSARGFAPDARFDAARLREIAPPRIRLEVLRVHAANANDGPSARVRVVAERRAQPLSELILFVDDIPLTPFAERALAAHERERLARELDIPLAAGGSEIRAESLTGQAMGIAELHVPAGARSTTAPRARGELYVLAVGNNVFPELPDKDLDYAAQDAEAIAAMLSLRGGEVYRQVHTRVLSDRRDTKATRAAVLEALSFARRARAEDTVVLFLASHGVSDQAGNYWFVPRDARAEDFARYQAGSSEPLESFVSWKVFFDALREAAGRRILIVDTCAARGMQGKFKPHSLAKRSAASHFALMVAAQEDEESLEYPPAGHGLFTYALLRGFAPEADTNRDGRISIGELFAVARPLVESHGRQTPALIGPRSLEATAVASLPELSLGNR